METVHGGPGFVLQEFRCRVAARTPSSDERPRAHQIVFVRAGLFVRETPRDRTVADANHILFFNADEPYRIDHPLPGGDDCLVLSLPTEGLLDILAARDQRARDHAAAPFSFTHAPSTPRAAVLQRRLLSLSRVGPGGLGDGLELQEVAFDLAAEAIAAA